MTSRNLEQKGTAKALRPRTIAAKHKDAWGYKK